jgi:hypothetical protein
LVEEEQKLDAVAGLVEAGDGSGENEQGWAVGETVWVWDTDVPEKDAATRKEMIMRLGRSSRQK